jgi:uncharacterized protein (TIGR02246 family)
LKEAVERVAQRWAELYNEGDIAGLAGLYTEDAVIYANTGEVVRGKEAIREAFSGAYDAAPGGTTREAGEETEVLGDTAYTIGSYRVTGEGGETLSRGNFLTILKKQGEAWKIDRQIDNLDLSLEAGR